MIHQFFDYETVKETVKEGFESDTVETDPTEPTEPTKDEEDPNSNTKLLKDVGLLIVFYILFVAIFMISGSIMFKYIIMTRMGKSVVGTISGFPDNLSYRKSSNEAYDKFFSGDKERLIDKEYDCDYFTYNHKDENNEKSKVFLPIKFSYEPYYNNWLYRHDFNTGIPGTVYSLDADMDISAGEGEVNPNILSNTFPINWFWTTFTTIFTTTNNIFANGMTATVAIIIVLSVSYTHLTLPTKRIV